MIVRDARLTAGVVVTTQAIRSPWRLNEPARHDPE